MCEDYNMKKTQFIIFAVASLLLFFSCKNFFGGNDVLIQLEDQIEYINADSCTIFFDNANAQGSFLSSAEKTVKVGFPNEIQFNVKTDAYFFSDFVAVDRNDTSISLNDLVDFKITSTDDEIAKGTIKARITVLEQNNNILIMANCTSLPYVVSTAPSPSDTAYFANTPISITFNTPVMAETVSLENIFITSGGENIARFFESPKLSDDSKTITITTKALELVQFIKDRKAAFIEVSITVSDSVKAKVGEVEYAIIQNENSSWKYRYKPETETIPPEKFDFEVSKTIPQDLEPAIAKANLLNQKAFAAFESQDFFTNYVNDAVYITGRYFDADSKIFSVIVNEVRTNAKDSSIINRPDTAKPYDFSSTFIANNEEKPLNITYEAEGYATFAIPYKIQTKEEGAIKISVSVLDACANPSQVQELTIIKSTGIDISNLDPYNYKLGNRVGGVQDFEGGTVFDSYPNYNSQEHKRLVKTIHIKKTDIRKIIYKDLEDTSFIPDVSIKYKNDSGSEVTEQLVYNAENEIYSIELSVSSTENLQFQIAVGENGTYTDSRSFLFPGKVYIFKISKDEQSNKIMEAYNTGTADKYLYFCDYYKTYKCREFTKVSTRNPAKVYFFFAQNGSLLGEYSDRSYNSDDPETLDNKANDLFFSNVQISPRPNTNSNLSIDINCYISDELWTKYDTIFLEYKNQKYYSWRKVYFEKNGTMVSCSESFNDYLYAYDEDIILYGIGKDGKFYKGCTFTLPKISSLPNSEQYDTISPSADKAYDNAKFYYPYLKDNGFNMFYAFSGVKDAVSGIKTIEYWTEANPSVKTVDKSTIIDTIKLYSASNSYTQFFILLPLPLTDTKEDELTYYLQVTDNNNNIKNVNTSLSLPETYFEIKDFVKGTTPKVSWYISYLSDKTTFTNKVESFLYVYNNGSWSLDEAAGGKTTIEDTPKKVEGKTYELSTETTLPKNAWVKLRVATYENVSYYKCNSLSAEKILYTGTSSTENYANTGSDAVLFYSDQPLFLRILATEYPYETCKNWSRELWEKRPIVVTEKSLPAGTAGKLASYNFKQDYSNIPDGGSFVTIVYFADGSVKMSDVRQK